MYLNIHKEINQTIKKAVLFNVDCLVCLTKAIGSIKLGK